MIPYGKQSVDEDDIRAVVEVLKSDWLTTGPKVAEFERSFSEYVGAQEAVAVNSGTAALHSAMYALGIGPGDEVIIPAMTFAATANCVVFQGGTPVFTDVDQETLLIDPSLLEAKISSKTKAVIAVDYAGQPSDYDRIKEIVDKHNLYLVADACHSLGAKYKGCPVGSLADLNIFSFHPVKHITTGEGGMITTANSEFAHRIQNFRNHGITTDHHQREKKGSWFYEMVELGYNYRITDFQCALGINQLTKLHRWIIRRQEIAKLYIEAFNDIPSIMSLKVRPEVFHAYHLYVVYLDSVRIGKDRGLIFQTLRSKGIGVNVHYIPVHLHPFYRTRFKTRLGLCPVAEKAYERIISLPIFPTMTDQDVFKVIKCITDCIDLC